MCVMHCITYSLSLFHRNGAYGVNFTTKNDKIEEIILLKGNGSTLYITRYVYHSLVCQPYTDLSDIQTRSDDPFCSNLAVCVYISQVSHQGLSLTTK